MQANYDITNDSTSICSFVSEKCGKEVKKLQKFEYLDNEKRFLMGKKKKLFKVMEWLSFGGKTKI